MGCKIVLSSNIKKIIKVGDAGADIEGFDSDSIQLAVDALRKTNGIVLLNEGTFLIHGPVRLADNITMQGSGAKTVLRKSDGFKLKLIVDADFGEMKVTVKDTTGFRKTKGDQLCIRY